MHNFRKLQIWIDGIDLADMVYSITKGFPSSELFGLVSQMQRAAVSVPSNIAEGASRNNKEFARFLSISLGSLFELETQAIIANRRNYIDNDTLVSLNEIIVKLQRQVTTFKNSLDCSLNQGEEVF